MINHIINTLEIVADLMNNGLTSNGLYEADEVFKYKDQECTVIVSMGMVSFEGKMGLMANICITCNKTGNKYECVDVVVSKTPEFGMGMLINNLLASEYNVSSPLSYDLIQKINSGFDVCYHEYNLS